MVTAVTGADDTVEGGRLAENIAYFGRALRAAGLPIGPGQIIDAVSAVEAAHVGTKQDLYWTLHAVMVTKHEQSVVFDQAFRIFWRRRAYLERLMSMLMPVATDRAERPKDTASRRVSDAMFANIASATKPKPRLDIDATFTVSDAELLQRKDFEQMSVEELLQARIAVRRMAIAGDLVRTRRLAPDAHGRLVDMRRTLRASLRGGGALIELQRRDRRERRPPLVALCDISGSMSSYTRLFLHFLHALSGVRRDVHVFLFGTRLTNVTRQLRAKDPDEALAACSKSVPDWSGGTRIASSLHAFNRDWSRRVLTQGATVLLVTDGLERDDHGLEPEIARLGRSSRRLIWLNPLLRYEAFQPKARGVRTILPHVDEFRPVHNLDSIEALVAALSDRHMGEADPRHWLRTG